MADRKLKKVVITRCAHSEDEIPDTWVYKGHPDDALFEFVYQVLGYSIVIVEVDGDDVSARPM